MKKNIYRYIPVLLIVSSAFAADDEPPRISPFTLGSIYNDQGASHRVEFYSPKQGTLRFIPTGANAEINEAIPFWSNLDTKNVTADNVSSMHRIIKGDHTYLILNYIKGVWAIRVKDNGKLSKRDRKEIAPLTAGDDTQTRDIAVVHPKPNDKKKTAAILALTQGEYQQMVQQKANGGSKRFSSMVRKSSSAGSNSSH